MSERQPSEAWWKAHADESPWHVKWGFDSGDCFCVYPFLPKLPNESEGERCTRSFVPCRDADELLCIASGVVEVLLRRILSARFVPSLQPIIHEQLPYSNKSFDWYFENVYTVDTCRGICDVLRQASGKFAALSDDVYAFLDENGEVMSYKRPEDWIDPLPLPSEAAKDCLLIADYLERVIASAEKQGALVTFSGP